MPKDWSTWGALNKALSDNTLARVLIGFIWKQGDLNTLRHVFRGIHGEPVADGESGVMYQFGRHLSSPSTQPIFDQHTYRAHRLVISIDKWKTPEELKAVYGSEVWFRKGDSLPNGALGDYLAWWNETVEERLPSIASDRLKALAAVDRLLFSLGKAAKLVAKDLYKQVA